MENTQYRTVFGATGKIGKALLGYLSRAQVPTIAVTRDRKNNCIYRILPAFAYSWKKSLSMGWISAGAAM